MNKKTLILLAIALPFLTIGAGCATKVAVNPTDNAASSTAVVATTTVQVAAFSIKELGITFNIPTQYKDEINYQISSDGKAALMYWNNHISKDVMGQDSNCKPGELGKITKGINPINSETGDARDPIAGTDIKVGNNYITIEGPQDLCTGDKNLQKSITDMIEALENAVPTVRDSAHPYTVGTLTYQNNTYGFAFPYPADTVVTANTPQGGRTHFYIGGPDEKGGPGVWVKANTNNQTLQQAFDENYNKLKADAISGADYKLNDLYTSDLKVDGKDAKELYVNNFGDVGSTMVTVVNNGYVYLIAGGQKKGDLDNFLSTYKFTSPAVATNTTITYKNTKYGFSLTLPKEWIGYSTAERVLEWGDFGKSDSIDYGFVKGKELESLFNISIHSTTQWKNLQASEGPVPIYLGEHEGIILGWSGSQDASNENMVRRSQVDEIVASFKWVDKN